MTRLSNWELQKQTCILCQEPFYGADFMCQHCAEVKLASDIVNGIAEHDDTAFDAPGAHDAMLERHRSYQRQHRVLKSERLVASNRDYLVVIRPPLSGDARI